MTKTTNWPIKKLTEVARIDGGGTPSTKNPVFWNGDIPWLTPKELSDLNDKEIFDTERKITKEGLEHSSTRLFPVGTVLLTSRAPIGYVAVAGIQMATNQGFKNFICNAKLLNNVFLYYFLKFKTKYLQSLGRGATFTEISRSILAKVEIPLPPLATQKKIVEWLDKIAEAQKINDELIQKSNELFQSLLHKEFNFKAGEWKQSELNQLTDCFQDGNWIESDDQSLTGIRLIQTGNIGMGKYIDKPDRSRYISDETFVRLKCTEVFPGDILISRLPDPVGRSCLMPDLGTKMITAVDCTIVRFNEKKIIPEYFVLYSNIGFYYSELKKHLTGSSRQRVSRSNLGKTKIWVPPLKIQKQIVDKLSAVQDYKTQLLAPKSKLKELFDSALHKSMKGEVD